jgi:hydroxymethylbilane synthase
MLKKTLRIATRQSPLALWQANHIKQQLTQAYPDLEITLLGMTTTGDRLATGALAKVGGKRLFVKELEQALLDNAADIAVHSMKDVPLDFPAGLGIAAICQRDDPRDVFISNKYKNLADLPAGSIIGTASPRRTCQLRALRSDFTTEVLRGNIGTRLRHLDENKFDAIILAAAGLIRLGLTPRISEYLAPEIFLPAAGQGALGIECRLADKNILELIKFLDHSPTHACIIAERALNQQLEGGCQVPIAAYAVIRDNQLMLRALVGSPNNSLILRAAARAALQDAAVLGKQVADDLLSQGAEKILQEFRDE